MSKKDVINYVMNTPGNTNPAVLETLLNENDSNKFLITLTLTSESGGIMDKSNKEIAEAYNAGKEIWFTGNMGDLVGTFPLKALTYVGNHVYPFIGVEFDFIDASMYEIYSTSKYMISVIATDVENYTFAMKSYTLDPDRNRFIVTLTPNALDYSGTMDRTVEQIDDAYRSGKQIIFHMIVDDSWYEMDSNERGNDSSSTYPSYNALGVVGTTMLKVYTGTTNDSTSQTYSTSVYTLTYAS